MSITNAGKNHVIDLLMGDSTEVLIRGGFGVDSDTLVADVNLQSSVIVLDECDATAGWSQYGDATAPSLDTTNYQESTGSLAFGYSYSTGGGGLSKNITTVDLSPSNTKLYAFIYIDDVTNLTTSSSAVYIDIGTGGFTNANRYGFANTSFGDGWNALIADVGTVTSVIGSGCTESSVTHVRLGLASSNTMSSTELRIDYIRAVVDGGFGLADSFGAFTSVQSDKSVQITYKVLSNQSNGYQLSSSGVSTTSLLFSKQYFTPVGKDENLELQVDEYFTVK